MRHQSESEIARILILVATMILGLISMSKGAEANCKCEIEGAVFHVWYLDNDGDGMGDAFNARIECIQPTGYVDNSFDQDDTTYDNSLDRQQRQIQEWFRDEDGDGFGDPLQVMISAICPPGYVGDFSDPDDSNAKILFHKNAQELLTQNKAH